jgi:hypothetical protein
MREVQEKDIRRPMALESNFAKANTVARFDEFGRTALPISLTPCFSGVLRADCDGKPFKRVVAVELRQAPR